MCAIVAGDARACHLRVVNNHRWLEAGVGGVMAVGAIRGAGHVGGQACKGGRVCAIMAGIAGGLGNHRIRMVKLRRHPRRKARMAEFT